MSNKHFGLKGSAESEALVVQRGRRSGKGLAATAFQIWKDIAVDPPATAREAEAYCRIQIKRCNINLANAKDRGDKRAAVHLERKLAVYQFLHQLVKTAPTVPECPHCLVCAVDDNGVCACCGKTAKETAE